MSASHAKFNAAANQETEYERKNGGIESMRTIGGHEVSFQVIITYKNNISERVSLDHPTHQKLSRFENLQGVSFSEGIARQYGVVAVPMKDPEFFAKLAKYPMLFSSPQPADKEKEMETVYEKKNGGVESIHATGGSETSPITYNVTIHYKNGASENTSLDHKTYTRLMQVTNSSRPANTLGF